MDDHAQYNFMMPPSIWSKKPSKSRYKMTIAYAAKHHPEATPILSTREVYSKLGSIASPVRPKTPREEAHHEWLISRIGAKSDPIEDAPEPDTTHRQ